MSIDQTDVIDLIGVDPAKNEAQLFRVSLRDGRLSSTRERKVPRLALSRFAPAGRRSGRQFFEALWVVPGMTLL